MAALQVYACLRPELTIEEAREMLKRYGLKIKTILTPAGDLAWYKIHPPGHSSISLRARDPIEAVEKGTAFAFELYYSNPSILSSAALNFIWSQVRLLSRVHLHTDPNPKG